MPRFLRRFLIGCIAVTFGYLLLHAREPLRTTIGDPWSDANVLSSINYVRDYGFIETSFTDVLDVGPLTEDSYRYTHYPPLAEIIYGSIGKLGVTDIGTFRLFALGFSGLAIWLLFAYVRRLYNEDVAIAAAALWTTSLLWMMYADSIHQAPIMTASGFLALWGLVCALDTPRPRYIAALVVGSFACIFTSYDYWLFLPAAVLFTIFVKRGNPFARANRRFVLLCAAGCLAGLAAKCLAVIGAVGWHDFVADIRMQFLERSTSTNDRKFTSGVPTLIRRFTLVFTPLVWITIGWHAWRALRAPSLVAAVKDTAVWMFVTALGFFYIFAQLAASQMLPSQVMLPFYAIGSALILARLFEGRRTRWLAIGWLVVAPIWGFAIMLSIPRSNLERDDVAKVNDYMASHDRNDFMLSNLISIGHIQASFERHYWDAPANADPALAKLELLAMFEDTGADYVHAAIFTTPESRFIDKSLWPYALPRQQWSLTGWPYFFRARAYRMIKDVDHNVMTGIDAAHATKVFELANFNLYRIDRQTVIDELGRGVPHASKIDFTSVESQPFKLLGWSGPSVAANIGFSTITGFGLCEHAARDGNPCKTVLTNFGPRVKDRVFVPRAQLVIPVERACDLQLVFEFANATLIEITMNGFVASQESVGDTATFVVPRSSVRAGPNLLDIEDLANVIAPTTNVRTLAIEPRCDAQ